MIRAYHRGRQRARETGLSYVELIVAAGLMTAVMIPAMESLQQGHNAAAIEDDSAARRGHVNDRMAEVLALPFDELHDVAMAAALRTVPTTLSDDAGSAMRRLVFVSEYDGDYSGSGGDPFAAANVDAELLWVRIELEDDGYGMETLRLR